MQTGCGCVKLGSATAPASWSDHVGLVRGAVDAGITLFDTADAYSSGISERLLGVALRGRRDDVTIATKVGYVFRPRTRVEQQARRAATRIRPLLRNPFGGSAESNSSGRAGQGAADSVGGGQASGGYQQQDFSPEHIRRSLVASLDRLGTDYIDVYQLHGPPRLLDGALGALVEARDAGLVRSIGVGAESIESAAAWSACPEIDVVQLPFGVLDPEAAAILGDDRAAMPNRRFWVRGVLGGGILAAAMRDPAEIDEHPKRRLVLDLIDIADGAGMRLDELAVRWVRSHDDVDAMLVGISSPEHIRRTVALSELAPLPADVIAAVDSAQANSPREAT